MAASRPQLWPGRDKGSGVKFRTILDGTRLAAGGLGDFGASLVVPTLRLGVTGLARSGKTVFITALVRALVEQGRLPMLQAHAQGRITRVYLAPQPDDGLPRFPYEEHLANLVAKDRVWPESTNRISQLRLTIEFTSRGLLARNFGRGYLNLDIVDYPVEWLLDLPLMNMTYQQWSEATIKASREPARADLAKPWHGHLATLDATARADELEAIKAAELFTAYLAQSRKDGFSTLPPGRFLMPGDYAGSPLLNFAPLDVKPDTDFSRATLGTLMARRYNSYVDRIVRPFFFGNFARLDRQIVLADTLTALNAGTAAIQDLQTALGQILSCFRQGSNSVLSNLFGRRIDRILFAATKADHLHQSSHDRLEAVLRYMVEDASRRAEYAGARIDVAALAAIRATREARVVQKGEELDCIAGIPQAGEQIGATTFDGETEAAVFPGDLPLDPAEALSGKLEGTLKFVRFRPPLMRNGQFPHIRLDRAIEFLIGDRLA